MEAYEKGGNIDVQLINTKISDKIFIVRIRRKERASRSGVQLQYTVISLASEEDVKNNTPSSSAKPSQKSNVSKKLFSEDVIEKELNDEGSLSSSQAPDNPTDNFCKFSLS
ncbi:hypothetical protein ACJIZ3_006498 [Penstemon smallii]|uniref:Uncharacterized protein n=1 Tax=Penstemon smallii TaxID=265156 RepID=A0ABD3S833_9LAMI